MYIRFTSHIFQNSLYQNVQAYSTSAQSEIWDEPGDHIKKLIRKVSKSYKRATKNRVLQRGTRGQGLSNSSHIIREKRKCPGLALSAL